MNRSRIQLIVFLVFVVAVELIAAWIVGLNRPAWEDEAHFYETVKLFGNDFSLQTLRTYPEMSTPVPFIAYSLWGHVVGFQLSHLRVLSIVLAVLTYLIFFKLLRRTFHDTKLVFIGAVLLVIQPYMIGFSLFVYTDISAILFGTLALLAIATRSPWWTVVALALAVLCRQYMAFLTVAATLFYLYEVYAHRKSDSFKQLLAVLASAIPYLALVIFWGGTSPVNNLRQQFLSDPMRFHPEMLSLYIASLFVYLFPLIILNFRSIYLSWKAAALSVLGVGFIILFPISVSKPLALLGVSRVGQFHRLLRAFTPNEFVIQMLFAVCFLFALPLIIRLCRDLISSIRGRLPDFRLFIMLSIASFLVMMPFAYLGWEKYLMPVIPGSIIYLMMIYKANESVTDQEPS